jgi:hypothetical protein
MAYPLPIERRHPYCDSRLIELVLSMPGELKWEIGQAKVTAASRWHHRRALKSKLPQSVLGDRIGTEFTPALANAVKMESIWQWLNQTKEIHLVKHGYLNQDLLQKHIENVEYPDLYLIAILALEAWFRLL